MKTFAFEQWCDRLQLPTATRDFLLRLRSSPPARRVQGRLLNVCGTYASRKMGVSVQFESHTVELWAIYTMEYDRAVLEFFDQPCQLELHYQGPSGCPTKALHTPDFLVLHTDGASFLPGPTNCRSTCPFVKQSEECSVWAGRWRTSHHSLSERAPRLGWQTMDL